MMNMDIKHESNEAIIKIKHHLEESQKIKSSFMYDTCIYEEYHKLIPKFKNSTNKQKRPLDEKCLK